MELSDSKVELVARKNKVVYQDGNRVEIGRASCRERV